MTPSDRHSAAFAQFDAANREDPHKEVYEGKEQPKEFVYSLHMTRWLDKLAPDASEALRLAARCQHICRWKIPRDTYPMTRTGYKQWRTDLAKYHAEKAGQILGDVGYEEEIIQRVQSLLQKENLKLDPETQLLEDVIGVVFVENYMEEFAQQHEEEKLLTILRKTWKKMSSRGHQAILNLELPAPVRELLEKALEAGTRPKE